MIDSHRIHQFVEDLSSVELKNVFNPYADVCAAFDKCDAASIRRKNLEEALNSALLLGTSSIWIAQDLGYRGGRRTGLALTDEAHLESHGEMLQVTSFRKATEGSVVKERTADVVWHALRSVRQPVFLWNVFPLHPHLPNEPFSNRCHKGEERVVGMHFLTILLQVLNPTMIVTIGAQSTSALRKVGLDVNPVRHPSYGGQNSFLSGIAGLYGCNVSQDLKSQPLFDCLEV